MFTRPFVPLVRVLTAALLAAAPAAAVVSASAQEGPFELQPLKGALPDDLDPAIRDLLSPDGWRVLDGKGEVYAEFWLRRVAPLDGPYKGAVGNVLYPTLKAGELIGALRYPKDGIDYRDQSILPGTHTLRYSRHPVDGNHQDVSPYRDFLVMVPAEDDATTDPIPERELFKLSGGSTGSSHPGLLWIGPPPETTPEKATLVEDADKDLWLIEAALPVKVGDDETGSIPLKFVIFGVFD